jgi:insertion element IS1 protein InsB
LVNSCGINDIARVLRISKNTVSSRILKMAHLIKPPVFSERFQSYEMDELYTKIDKKQYWVIYAINRKTKQVINFAVGSKTNQNLSKVVNTLLLLNPKKIYTDKLKSYNTLIPKSTHNNSRYQTNRIERFNLNLRTHLKRLHRRTICYSKSVMMLEAIIRIYFWGYQLGFK